MGAKLSSQTIAASGASSLRVWIAQAGLKVLGDPKKVDVWGTPDALYVTVDIKPRVQAMYLGRFRIMRFGKKNGGAWLTIPSSWRKQTGLRKGSRVQVVFENRGAPAVRITLVEE